MFSASYVGSKGRQLPRFIDVNLPSPTTLTYTVSGGPLDGQEPDELPFFSGTRPNANFGRLSQITYDVDTTYNALVLALDTPAHQKGARYRPATRSRGR